MTTATWHDDANSADCRGASAAHHQPYTTPTTTAADVDVHDAYTVTTATNTTMALSSDDDRDNRDDLPIPSKSLLSGGREAKLAIQHTANNVDEVKWNQIRQLLRAWLSPVDPSTNHNIARKAQHKGTAVWLFQGNFFIEWKSTGSLLWIHGKPGSGKSVICSSVIQDIMTVCEAGSAIVAYFYFDFKDLKKQTCHDLLLSLVSQLSTRSSPCCNILHHVYKTHEDGTRQPSDDTLKECLKEMLRLLKHGPIFIVLDALDECPDSPGIPSPRHEVLQLVKELIDLGLQRLHICATSRPEVDIRAVLEPLASRSVSLHNQSGQQTDIADYIQSVVNLSLSSAMRRWRADDRNLVIKMLTERADGMFRWVFCQLDALQHCFPPNLRQFLNELPETLDETYERILRGINKAQKDNARRLLQCLAVAVRPLRVEELAELLAFDFQASSSGIPKLKDDWRWDNHEEAVLSTCSSLIAIVPSRDSRVVQFSHFSVKEYLTSPRLARSHEDVSKFHIDLDAAHMILAQACLGTLLRLDEHIDIKGFPLVKYAAKHWVDHARFEKVSSRVQDGIDDLFDGSKPHFAAWIRVHSVDRAWYFFSTDWFRQGIRDVRSESPLYYAAFCGFYDLAEGLIMKHPEQVNQRGGRLISPLQAALFQRHFGVANLLHNHGAVVDLRGGNSNKTPLYNASISGRVDVMRWLLNHGADPNAQKNDGRTPLHAAARDTNLEVVQVLLEHNADVNSRADDGKTPLHDTILLGYRDHSEGETVDVVRGLLEYGADPNACDNNHSTPLHEASSKGLLEAARMLLSYGANVDEEDGRGMTPFQVASSKGRDEIRHEMTKLLLEHGAVARP
ncbi:ankyrin repeat-containing domain protein [Lactarius deliciosus]|nr:ankyrin repeat-containing domain protein [Lactarius deliciosus]